MISLPGDTNCRLVGYWMGGALRDTGWGEDFPQLADIGPVSHTMSRDFPWHRYMVDTFVEAVGRGEVKNSSLKGVTTRAIYKSRMSFQKERKKEDPTDRKLQSRRSYLTGGRSPVLLPEGCKAFLTGSGLYFQFSRNLHRIKENETRTPHHPTKQASPSP